MLRYETAIDTSGVAEAAAARDWLLRYNRSDVEATLALRNWLESTAGS
jgi:predicted RecB family nuclease